MKLLPDRLRQWVSGSQNAEKFKALLRKRKMSTHPGLVFAALTAEPTPDQPDPAFVSALPIGCQSCYKQYGM